MALLQAKQKANTLHPSIPPTNTNNHDRKQNRQRMTRVGFTWTANLCLDSSHAQQASCLNSPDLCCNTGLHL